MKNGMEKGIRREDFDPILAELFLDVRDKVSAVREELAAPSATQD